MHTAGTYGDLLLFFCNASLPHTRFFVRSVWERGAAEVLGGGRGDALVCALLLLSSNCCAKSGGDEVSGKEVSLGKERWMVERALEACAASAQRAKGYHVNLPRCA